MRHLAWWLDGVKTMSVDQTLDRAFLELRLGPWAMAQYCGAPGLVRYAPLLTYKNVALRSVLPPAWKHSDGFTRAVIAWLWPELLKVPFHRRGAPTGSLNSNWADPATLRQAVGSAKD